MSESDPQPAADGPTPAATPAQDPAATGASAPAAEPAPPEPAGEIKVARRERQVRTVDFSQPTKFTAELRRRIVRVLGPFCEAFALRLSSELRAHVELAVADSSQLTWAAAKAQMPASAIAVALEATPIERQLLLSIEPPLVLRALECLLGGAAANAPSERRLSDIDWALTRRLLESLTTQLSTAWRDLGELELTLGEIDVEGDGGLIAPLGEPTFAVDLECAIDGQTATMSLLIPWSAIEPVAETILGGGPEPEGADPATGGAVHRSLAGAHVRLRAEVGAIQMPVERMLALTPGALLALGDRAEHGVQLFAEGVPLCRARPGLRGARRAVKLVDPHELTGGDPPGAARAAATGSRPTAPVAQPPTREGLARMLGVPVRVWAELGRTTLPLGHALELPPGAVVELEQSAEAPIELFVNGLCFAHGALEVTAEGEWAVRIEALTGPARDAAPEHAEARG